MNKLLLLLAISLAGCSTLDKGADPLVVRCEQVQRIALATFDTFLRFDDSRRAWMKDKAPEAHAFAEWLREDIGTGSRGIVMLEGLQTIKSAYKKSKEQSNKDALVKYLAAVESALGEAQLHLTAATKGN